MRTVYHLWLSPFCRKVRIVLAEKGLEFDMQVEKLWERRDEFLALNPAGDLPVLIEEDGLILSDATAIAEYLDEAHPDPPLLGRSAPIRAEVRRLAAWFDLKFEREVTRNLVDEKIMKRFLGLGEPNSQAIRAGSANIHTHLDYISYLTEERRWLAGNDFSLADISAAAHLSCVDYLGDVPWGDHELAKEWYARKIAPELSRASWRPYPRLPATAPLCRSRFLTQSRYPYNGWTPCARNPGGAKPQSRSRHLRLGLEHLSP